jgi:hypothetical protein
VVFDVSGFYGDFFQVLERNCYGSGSFAAGRSQSDGIALLPAPDLVFYLN